MSSSWPSCHRGHRVGPVGAGHSRRRRSTRRDTQGHQDGCRGDHERYERHRDRSAHGTRRRRDVHRLGRAIRGGREAGTRARQRPGRMALLGWRRLEHPVLAARSDQRVQLRQAESRLAVERRAPSARTSTTGRRRSMPMADCSRSPRRAGLPPRSTPRTARRSGCGGWTRASGGRKRHVSLPAAARPTGLTARASASSSRHPATTLRRSTPGRACPIPSSARTASST